MAMLLGVHPSQWSMFESGKRSLPTSAMQLLTEILVAADAPAVMAKASPQAVRHQAKQRHQLERMLRENEYQRLQVARKIAAAENKQQVLHRRMRVADHLNNCAAKGTFAKGLCKVISDKASLAVEAEDVGSFIKLEMKRDLLEVEKGMLEVRLKKL
jgi:hypothetical protein